MSETKNPATTVGATDIDRRSALKTLGGLAAAGAGTLHATWVHANTTFKIGYVAPQTGPLAVFAEPDPFTLAEIKKLTANGIKAGGKTYAVEVIYKDSQSNSSRAAEVTNELILKNKVDLVISGCTPETTNPVADTCELNGMPCVTNDTPWQPHFFGRGGDPKKGFEWTNHFFLCLVSPGRRGTAAGGLDVAQRLPELAIGRLRNAAHEAVLVHPQAGFQLRQGPIGRQLEHRCNGRGVLVDHQRESAHLPRRVAAGLHPHRAAQPHRHHGRVGRPRWRAELQLLGCGQLDRTIGPERTAHRQPARAVVRPLGIQHLRLGLDPHGECGRQRCRPSQCGEVTSADAAAAGHGDRRQGVMKQAFLTLACRAR